jgi:REP element-mobilizing transposase RayT
MAQWGGKRQGAGRPKGKRSVVAHRARPVHEASHPVHVTWRIVRGLPSLRNRRLAGVVGRTIRAITQAHRDRRSSFRILHFSIQADHLHLIVEAETKEVLIAGLRGLAIWIARRLNVQRGGHGRVFAERYHARPLTTPRQMRNAIVYVLHNHKHHSPSRFLVDECSSGPWFDGWASPVPRPATASPVSEPATRLARTGWRRYGPIGFQEEPAPKPLF